MDAAKFLKERKRLCQMYEVCARCPACRASGGCIFSVTNGAAPEEQSEFVEAWSVAHPRKTRQSVFLEQYPEAALDRNGVMTICPAKLFKAHRSGNSRCNNQGKLCIDCRREFWMQEVE